MLSFVRILCWHHSYTLLGNQSFNPFRMWSSWGILEETLAVSRWRGFVFAVTGISIGSSQMTSTQPQQRQTTTPTTGMYTFKISILTIPEYFFLDTIKTSRHFNQLMDKMTQFPHRIVVYGDDMLAAVLPNSAKPFNFQREYTMMEETVRFFSSHWKNKKYLQAHVYLNSLLSVKTFVAPQALRVSDHYPVEVELREVTPFWMENNSQKASVSRAVTGTE